MLCIFENTEDVIWKEIGAKWEQFKKVLSRSQHFIMAGSVVR